MTAADEDHTMRQKAPEQLLNGPFGEIVPRVRKGHNGGTRRI